MKRLALLLLLLPLAGCAPSYVAHYYVYKETFSTCGYDVRLEGGAMSSDVQVSKCLPLQDATDLAAKLNDTMTGKWNDGARQ